MVQSKINKEIDYIESKGLDQTDKDFDASMYQTELFGIDLVISLGKPKYTYIDKQVIYMPVYLIYDSEVVMQMGVYEIASTELPNILDEDGDVDLDLLSPPLLYKSTTPTMIRKMLEEEISEKESKQAEADAAKAEADAAKAAADEDASKAAADEDAAKAAVDEDEDSDQDAEEKTLPTVLIIQHTKNLCPIDRQHHHNQHFFFYTKTKSHSAAEPCANMPRH